MRVDNKTVLVLLGKLSCSADDLIDKPSQIHRLGIEFELSSFDLREVQYFVDEAQEVGPGGIDTAQRFQRLFRAEARRISGHHLGQADNGIEGRPQLVAHAGEELRLALARLRQLPALVLDFVEQPHVLDRDHRLVDEGHGKFDLPLAEWPHHAPHQYDDANGDALTQQGNPECGARTSTTP